MKERIAATSLSMLLVLCFLALPLSASSQPVSHHGLRRPPLILRVHYLPFGYSSELLLTSTRGGVMQIDPDVETGLKTVLYGLGTLLAGFLSRSWIMRRWSRDRVEGAYDKSEIGVLNRADLEVDRQRLRAEKAEEKLEAAIKER